MQYNVNNVVGVYSSHDDTGIRLCNYFLRYFLGFFYLDLYDSAFDNVVILLIKRIVSRLLVQRMHFKNVSLKVLDHSIEQFPDTVCGSDYGEDSQILGFEWDHNSAQFHIPCKKYKR